METSNINQVEYDEQQINKQPFLDSIFSKTKHKRTKNRHISIKIKS